MITLEQLWHLSGAVSGTKVRFIDWNHRFKYFEIQGMDESGKRLEGLLSNGESISYDKNSRNWILYQKGDENVARAV